MKCQILQKAIAVKTYHGRASKGMFTCSANNDIQVLHTTIDCFYSGCSDAFDVGRDKIDLREFKVLNKCPTRREID